MSWHEVRSHVAGAPPVPTLAPPVALPPVPPFVAPPVLEAAPEPPVPPVPPVPPAEAPVPPVLFASPESLSPPHAAARIATTAQAPNFHPLNVLDIIQVLPTDSKTAGPQGRSAFDACSSCHHRVGAGNDDL